MARARSLIEEIALAFREDGTCRADEDPEPQATTVPLVINAKLGGPAEMAATPLSPAGTAKAPAVSFVPTGTTLEELIGAGKRVRRAGELVTAPKKLLIATRY